MSTSRKSIEEKMLDLMKELIDLVEEPSELIKASGTEVGLDSWENPLHSRAYEKVAENLAEGTAKVFDLLASELGATGMQASWAANQVWAKTMNAEGPVLFLKFEDYLYPQYDGKVTDYFESPEVQEALREKALELLEARGEHMAPAVRQRMVDISTGAPIEMRL